MMWWAAVRPAVIQPSPRAMVAARKEGTAGAGSRGASRSTRGSVPSSALLPSLHIQNHFLIWQTIICFQCYWTAALKVVKKYIKCGR